MIRLAWRSLWRHKRRTLITVVSIALGLTFAIFFISLAFGTYYQLVNDAVRMQAGHITLEHKQYRQAPSVDLWLPQAQSLREALDQVPEVESTKLLVLSQGVAKSGIGSQGVGIIGVEPGVEYRTSPLAKNIDAGTYLADGDGAWAVIGSELAKHLNLEIGKKFVVTTNDVQGALVEELLRVKGIFKTGSEELDAYIIQISLPEARKIFGLPEHSATQLGVVLKKSSEREKVMRFIRGLPKDASTAVYRWEEILPEVAAWVDLDRGSNLIFQAILLCLILFTIFNTILMSVLERRREFAVLLAIGTPKFLLQKQVLLESFFMGLIGCAGGVICGGSLALWAQVKGIDISYFYDEGMTISGFAISTVLHARPTLALLSTMTAIVLVATLLVSVPSIRKAANVSMTEWLRG